jgi:hypothetical protein
MVKVTTVRLTHRELRSLHALEEKFGLKHSQLIRMIINRFYDLVLTEDQCFGQASEAAAKLVTRVRA